MKFYGDYHIHTDFSDGKSTIVDCIRTAKNKGLQEIAITEHGLRNPSYSKKKFYSEYDAVKKLESESSIGLLFGNEADLISENGDIDIGDGELQMLDLLLVGFHQFSTAKSIRDWWRIYRPSVLNPFYSKRSTFRKRNTDALIRCIQKNDVDVIAHPNHRFFFDAKEVGKACADARTYIELNVKHLDALEEMMDGFLSTDVLFIVNSDSHNCLSVGEFGLAQDVIEKYGISSRVVNLDNRPIFKNHR